MAVFLSSFEKKIDKKGRVIVPSSFRAVLASESFNGVVAYRSFINPCIEVCAMSRIEALSEEIEMLDTFSEEKDAFAATILGGCVQMTFDSEGRIVLPRHLLDEVGIEGQSIFVGKGKTFEIWQPELFAEYTERARKIARDRRSRLGATIMRRVAADDDD